MKRGGMNLAFIFASVVLASTAGQIILADEPTVIFQGTSNIDRVHFKNGLLTWESGDAIYAKQVDLGVPYFLISDATDYNDNPMTDGRFVVWQHENAPQSTYGWDEIWVYDTETSNTDLLFGYNSAYGYWIQDVDEGMLIYLQINRTSAATTYKIYDLNAHTHEPVTIPGLCSHQLITSRDLIVHDGGGMCRELQVYNTVSMATTSLVSSSYRVAFDASDDFVVWWNNDSKSLCYYDLQTRFKKTIFSNPYYSSILDFQTGGNIVIWDDNGLFGHYIGDNNTFTIYDSSVGKFVISGNHVVWGSGGNRLMMKTIPFSPCITRPASDLNGDCRVDLEDFALFALEWLVCGLKDQSFCW